MHYDDVITNPRWRTDAILKIVVWLYLGAILADQREIWNRDEGSAVRSVTLNLANKFSQCTFSVAEHYDLFSDLIILRQA